MNIRTRHMALLTYSGISALAIAVKPELLADVNALVLILAPIGGMFVWDKIAANRAGVDSTDPK